MRGRGDAETTGSARRHPALRLFCAALAGLSFTMLAATTASASEGHAPSLSVGNATVTEGDKGTTEATFELTLSKPSAHRVTVRYEADDGTATGGDDFAASSGVVTFKRGRTTKLVSVQILGDTDAEPEETFLLILTKSRNARIADGSGSGTITDDDGSGVIPGGVPGASPTLSINNVSITEGNSGLKGAAFNVSLSAPSTAPVTVAYATANGSATAPADYQSKSGSLTFDPGEVSKSVTVQVVGDSAVEANETFSVNLSNPTNATIEDGSGLGTITDNDTVTATISNVTVVEGNSGTTNAVFSVSLSAPSGVTVTVDYASGDGSATSPADYNPVSGTVTFNPGQVSKQIVVQVVGDVVAETNEAFSVNLTDATNASIGGSGFGLGTITDNDTVSVTIGNVTVTEGNAGTQNAVFTVSLSSASGSTVTVDYQTADGSATAPLDYIATSGTVTFNPGQVSKQIVVQVVGELVPETNEVFSVNLTSATNASIGGSGVGLGTINNND